MSQIWTYKGVNVYPAVPNPSGIRWVSVKLKLRADTKTGMRQLINAQQKARKRS